MIPEKTNRRTFLTATTGALAAGAIFAPSVVLGANDRIRIGVIGGGGRSNSLCKDIAKNQKEWNATVVAVCDVWKKNRDTTVQNMKDLFGSDPKPLVRYADLLAMPDVDAVIIATPDFAHSPILADAAKAGKHAYCEKPMATNMRDANNAVEAVEQSGIICQVGTQRRSHIPHQQAAEIIRSGLLGKITEVEAAYNRCTPSWLRDYGDVRKEDVDWGQYLMDLPERAFDPARFRRWHLYKDYSVGLPGLLGSHVIDLVHWYMDDPLPESGIALGGTLIWTEGREHADTLESAFLYPKGFLLRYVSRLGNSAGGYDARFYGDRGTFDSSTLIATGEGGGKEALKEPVKAEGASEAGDWSRAELHLKNWLDCIRSGKQPNADVHAGYGHSVVSILAFESMNTGRRMKFDPEKKNLVF
ncbi:MAG TPA: Gfo/Idh/MocA family oxidoreductase [bacterium]|nr:Gfo/Idh/MocA family oxidoreductase [bacterium]HQP97348.1 Gfo/Idh/MocA family oxidoreductase [bacterium]